ncbi:MAG TPA: hypothetical protein VHN77_15810 [Phycisphaerales bacterium]|nr:hypothetical protein [Phycisphaerales bacterium]
MPHARVIAFALVLAAGSTAAWAGDPTEETEEVLVQAAPATEPAGAGEQRGDGKFRILPVYRAGQGDVKGADAPGAKKAGRGTATRNMTITVVRGEGTVSREAVTVTPGGDTVVSKDQWTRESGVVTHTGSTTMSDGGSASRECTVTRDADGASRDAMRVTMTGRTVSKSVRVEREADSKSIARTAVTTGPAGGTVTAKDTWTREGAEASHEGVTKTPRAMIQRSSLAARAGGAVNREATRDASREGKR